MKKVFQIFKWSVVVALLVVVLAFTNDRQQEQFLELNSINIELSEDKFLTDEIIFGYINKQNIQFDSVRFSKLLLEDLETTLQKHPAVKNVEVCSNQEGKIDVSLTQRKAVVRIKTNTTDFYLDEDGIEMPLSKHYTPRVLVVTGDVSPEDYSSVYSFTNYINKIEFWNSQITQLHFINDEVVIIPRVGNQKIHFGTLTNVKGKLENLYQFYKQAMPVKGWQTYTDISLRYNNQIVCTKK